MICRAQYDFSQRPLIGGDYFSLCQRAPAPALSFCTFEAVEQHIYCAWTVFGNSECIIRQVISVDVCVVDLHLTRAPINDTTFFLQQSPSDLMDSLGNIKT